MNNKTKMPDEIELGLFYAPAPMSEYFYSVIDDKAKMEPVAKKRYICATINDELLEALRVAMKASDDFSKPVPKLIFNRLKFVIARAEAAKGE